ncbi:unnamed protein product, partial [Rotaria sp. Silwood1]
WREVCDGKWDCDNGLDEAGCGQFELLDECQYPAEYRCTNGQGCIPTDFAFDFDYDCADGSDEQGD